MLKELDIKIMSSVLTIRKLTKGRSVSGISFQTLSNRTSVTSGRYDTDLAMTEA